VVSERRNRHGDRVWYRAEDGGVRSLARAWTSLGAADPWLVVAGGWALFRVGDLAALADMVAAQVGGVDRKGGSDV